MSEDIRNIINDALDDLRTEMTNDHREEIRKLEEEYSSLVDELKESNQELQDKVDELNEMVSSMDKDRQHLGNELVDTAHWIMRQVGVPDKLQADLVNKCYSKKNFYQDVLDLIDNAISLASDYGDVAKEIEDSGL